MIRPETPPPAPPLAPAAAAARELGAAFGRLLSDLLKLAGQADESRARLRAMLDRNATRDRLTVRRRDLRAVLDELDAHRARLAAGGEQ